MSLPTEGRVVESGLRLSQSFIWKLQARFYESLGVEAWLSGVIPSKITTNSYIAYTYARMIAAYVRDMRAESVTILELGAGHGRFGFHCARHLAQMSTDGLLPAKRWKYVLTDVAERNVGYWQEHASLRPLVEQGVLDFARFEVGVDEEIRLRIAGTTIGRNAPVEQLVIIGNYFFDSLPIDVWQIEDGVLHECRPVLKLKPDASCVDPSDAAILDQLELDWNRVAVDRPVYEDPLATALIGELSHDLGEGAFSWPVGGAAALAQLDNWTADGYLLLSADKGYLRDSELRGRPLPTMVQHGCFSFSVNFCALARWFEHRGGHAWLPNQLDGSLEFGAFASRRRRDQLPSTTAAFYEGPAQFSPGDFHEITRRCDRNLPDLRNCIALCRLSCYEPQVLYRLRRAIRAGLADASSVDRQALRNVLERTLESYFRLDEEDVFFAAGLIYQQLGDFVEAESCYRRSLAEFGEDATSLYNLSVCLTEMSRLAEACHCASRAVELDCDYAEAAALREQLCIELAATTSSDASSTR